MLERVRRRSQGERGFTLIEVLIAAGLSMVALMAVMSTFDGARDLVNEAERNEAAAHQAQRALEAAVSRPYDEIGLEGTAPPAPSADPNHPNSRVTSAGTYRYTTGQPAAAFEMGGTLRQQEAWQDATDPRLSGQVFRYVTAYQNGTAGAGKRVTVAVTVSGRRRPVTLSTIVRETE